MHTGIVGLSTTKHVLGRELSGNFITVFLVIRISPAIVKSVRSLEDRVNLTALHAFEFTVGTTEGEVRITGVYRERTIVRSQANRQFLTCVILFLEVYADSSPLFPYDIS